MSIRTYKTFELNNGKKVKIKSLESVYEKIIDASQWVVITLIIGFLSYMAATILFLNSNLFSGLYFQSVGTIFMAFSILFAIIKTKYDTILSLRIRQKKSFQNSKSQTEEY